MSVRHALRPCMANMELFRSQSSRKTLTKRIEKRAETVCRCGRQDHKLRLGIFHPYSLHRGHSFNCIEIRTLQISSPIAHNEHEQKYAYSTTKLSNSKSAIVVAARCFEVCQEDCTAEQKLSCQGKVQLASCARLMCHQELGPAVPPVPLRPSDCCRADHQTGRKTKKYLKCLRLDANLLSLLCSVVVHVSRPRSRVAVSGIISIQSNVCKGNRFLLAR